jgi:hypothetical protein
MAGDDRASVTVLDLVELLFRADWTSLSLAADLTEFEDFEVRRRMAASRRPAWIPQDAVGTAGRNSGSSTRSGPRDDHQETAAGAEDEDDEDDGIGRPRVRELSCRLLVEPGGRYRETWITARPARDAESGSPASADPDSGSSPRRNPDSGSPPGAGRDLDRSESWSRAGMPWDELLCPAWLAAGFELELAGSAIIAGRRAHRVLGKPRPVSRGDGRGRASRHPLRPDYRHFSSRFEQIDRIDAMVDAEIGILLRAEQCYRGQVVSRREFTSMALTEAGASGYDPPAGDSSDDSGFDVGKVFSGPGWDRAKTAANAGAAALTFAIRHAPHKEPPAGAQAGSPPPSYPGRDHQAGWSGSPGPDEPVSTQIIALLYQAGLRRTGFDAELRTWADTAPAADAMRQVSRKTSLSGVQQLADAISERATTWQSRESISVGLPDLYRIDYIDGGLKRRKSIGEVSDGTQRWRLFPGYVTVGNALPLPAEIARLADPAWLLDWDLTGGVEVVESGRRGYQLRVGHRFRPGSDPALKGSPVDAVVDAELGVLLRLTLERAGRPTRQQALAGLSVRQPEPRDYRLTIMPGTRVRQESGTVLDQADLSAPAQTAVQLTVRALATATKVGGFLDSLRKQGKDPGPR